jgi:hypothetical protein
VTLIAQRGPQKVTRIATGTCPFRAPARRDTLAPAATTPELRSGLGGETGSPQSGGMALGGCALWQRRWHVQTGHANPIVRHAVVDVEAFGRTKIVAAIDP